MWRTRRIDSIPSWSAASQFLPTQQARLASSVVSLQMQCTSRVLQLPKLVTQFEAQVGRPGMGEPAWTAVMSAVATARVVVKARMVVGATSEMSCANGKGCRRNDVV